MRIGIDARKIADYGIGTYIRGLLAGLGEINGPEEYVVFAPAEARGRIPFGEHVPLHAPHYSLQELFVVGRAIAGARLDLFHAPHYVIPLTRCPTVVTIHDLIHLHQRQANPLAPLYARSMIGRAVRKSARILTVSEAVRRDLLAAFGCIAERIIVTPNGVDARFTPEGAKRDGDYLLFVGNDKQHKNVDALVEAFGRVRREASGITLVLAGGRFDRLRGREGIDLQGFVRDEDLPSLYRGALALIVPSVEEGFGLPALEAMASGTPVITSRAPALVEVTGDAALHVDADDVDGLAEAVRRVITEDALRLSLAARGIERARAFTWRRCAELTRQVYAEAGKRN